MKKYSSYSLIEKIEILRNQPTAPDYYLKLVYGFGRVDVENEQLRNLLLQNNDTLQNVVKETILEMNRITPADAEPISFDEIVTNHAKKAISKRKK